MHPHLRPSALVSLALVSLVAYQWLGSASPAQATPISYDEAISGDLDGQHIGDFDIGANTVTGSAPFDVRAVFDPFLFTVPTGLQLDSIVVSSFSGRGQVIFMGPQGSFLGLIGPWMTFTLPERVGVDLLPELLLSDAAHPGMPPLPAGIYQVELASAFEPTTYTYTFNVSAAPEIPTIPEPATVLLTTAGTAAVLFTRFVRRKKVTPCS